jgi:hypothetical protein
MGKQTDSMSRMDKWQTQGLQAVQRGLRRENRLLAFPWRISCPSHAPNKNKTNIRTEKVALASESRLTCFPAPDPASNDLQLFNSPTPKNGQLPI